MVATTSTGGAAPCKMRAGTRLTMHQRTTLLIAAWAGHYPETLTNMATVIPKLVALSQPESAGYTQACNTNTNGTRDWGWLQINAINGGSSASYDPAVCAGQGLAVYHRQGYSAWSTYGGVGYLAALPAAKLAWARINDKQVVAGEASIAQTESAKGNHDCVYGWTLPSLGPIGGEFICFDTILGGLKMAAGAFGAGVTALGLLVVVARNVPGAGEAAGATRKVTSRLPAPAPVKAYRTVSGNRQRASSERARSTLASDRERRSGEQAQARQRIAESRERRAQQAEDRRGRDSGPRTVYVTDQDPMYETIQRRAREQRAKRETVDPKGKRARTGNPDDPNF